MTLRVGTALDRCVTLRGGCVKDISEFCRRMQEALNKRQRAATDEEKAEAEREMAETIRANFKQLEVQDYKVKQSGERED